MPFSWLLEGVKAPAQTPCEYRSERRVWCRQRHDLALNGGVPEDVSSSLRVRSGTETGEKYVLLKSRFAAVWMKTRSQRGESFLSCSYPKAT